jgi:hypothetical protein
MKSAAAPREGNGGRTVFDAEPIRQTGHKTVRNYGNPRHSQAPQSGVDFPPSGFGHGAGWFAEEKDMSSTTSSSSSSGIGFVGLLTIAFIVLKLTGVIAWPWLWVLAPVWISLGLLLAILAICGVVLMFVD